MTLEQSILAVVWGTLIHDQAAVMESAKLSFDLYILFDFFNYFFKLE